MVPLATAPLIGLRLRQFGGFAFRGGNGLEGRKLGVLVHRLGALTLILVNLIHHV